MKLILSFLTFGENIFAGMENALFNFAKGLSETGHQVVVFTSNCYGDSEFVSDIKVHRCRYLPIEYSGGDNIIKRRLALTNRQILGDLINLIKSEKPDAIISWDPLWGIIQTVDDFREISVPVLLVYHVNNGPQIIRESSGYPYAATYAVSHFLRTEIIKSGYRGEIKILPNSINYDWIRNEIDEVKKENVILCNARLSPEKGVEYCVEAFAKISKEYPKFKLWLCSGAFPFGDVEVTRKKIETLLLKLDINNSAVFLPNLDWAQVPRFIARSSIVVLPSLMESFGIAALETMATGTPLIASRVGNLPDLVQSNGVLVAPRSSEEIYQSLKLLIEDFTLYQGLCSKSPLEARKYDRKLVAQEFIYDLTRVI